MVHQGRDGPITEGSRSERPPALCAGVETQPARLCATGVVQLWNRVL